MTKFFQRFGSMIFALAVSWCANAGSEPSEQLKSRLSALEGQVVYVDFWASWCGPCRQSFPWLNVMQAQYKSRGFTVLSVNVDAKKSFALAFLEEFPASFEVIYDPKGKIARQYDLRGMPSSFIVDRTGEVVATHVGFNEQKQQQYEQEIIALLK
ncbi:TlpA family protein disulfide reductase [Thalassotalea sp. LPB0316]|uniref:TlpA disulfide reductase family protein n=1 Tax=Thalassotalea sp. LPB0316 TaxID=2769490 RepID=UPI001865D43B|nr:TlpA disulfide reductase family protein [Thalassotalea sp. LPB0316]QOL26822.1 TlpA family protein disulfide reductase [Thalassotalea sp. LPB0316]